MQNTIESVMPLGLQSPTSISDEQLDRLIRLDAYEFPFVEEALVHSGAISVEVMPSVRTEFKRFIALRIVVGANSPVTMLPSISCVELFRPRALK